MDPWSKQNKKANCKSKIEIFGLLSSLEYQKAKCCANVSIKFQLKFTDKEIRNNFFIRFKEYLVLCLGFDERKFRIFRRAKRQRYARVGLGCVVGSKKEGKFSYFCKCLFLRIKLIQHLFAFQIRSLKENIGHSIIQ
jgi:hypothetical protein